MYRPPGAADRDFIGAPNRGAPMKRGLPDHPLESAAVGASDSQLGTLNRSRLLSQPPATRLLTGHSSGKGRPEARNAKFGFLSTLFVEFPGNATIFVGSAGSTLFEEFPGNATKHVQKKVPEWGPEKSSGIDRPGRG